MVVEIDRPDRETRLAIIERLLTNRGISMTPAAMDRLSSQAVGSVREIEGAVTRVTAAVRFLSSNHKDVLGIDDVERVLRATPPTSHPIRMGDVINITSKRLGVSTEDVLARVALDRTVQAVATKIYSLGLLANKKYVVSNKLSVTKMDWLTEQLEKHGIKTVEGEYSALERKERSEYENMNIIMNIKYFI